MISSENINEGTDLRPVRSKELYSKLVEARDGLRRRLGDPTTKYPRAGERKRIRF